MWGLFEEMADTKSGARNVQDESEISCHINLKWSYQIWLRSGKQDSEADLKRFPLAKDVILWVPVRTIIAMN